MLNTRTFRPRMRRHRRFGGIQTLELLIILPILVFVFVATLQYGTTMIVEEAVTHSATVAAREAGKGATIEQLQCVVDHILCAHDIQIGPCASVVLEDPAADPPIQQAGTFPCEPPATPAIDEEFVRVTVCVDLTKKPFLSATGPLGLSFQGKSFTVSSVVKKESLDAEVDPLASESGFQTTSADCNCDITLP